MDRFYDRVIIYLYTNSDGGLAKDISDLTEKMAESSVSQSQANRQNRQTAWADPSGASFVNSIIHAPGFIDTTPDQVACFLDGQPIGTYLIRPSTQHPGKYTISFVGQKKQVLHAVYQSDTQGNVSTFHGLIFNICTQDGVRDFLYEAYADDVFFPTDVQPYIHIPSSDV